MGFLSTCFAGSWCVSPLDGLCNGLMSEKNEGNDMFIIALAVGTLLFFCVAMTIAVIALFRSIARLTRVQEQKARNALSEKLIGTMAQTLLNDAVAPLQTIVTMLPEYIEIAKRLENTLGSIEQRINSRLESLSAEYTFLAKATEEHRREAEAAHFATEEMRRSSDERALQINANLEAIKVERTELAKDYERLKQLQTSVIKSGAISGRGLMLELD